MTALEKVRSAESQIIAVATGRADHIDCPFCQTTTTQKEMLLCCDELADMTDVILDRIETGETTAIAKEAAGRAMDAMSRNPRRLVSLN